MSNIEAMDLATAVARFLITETSAPCDKIADFVCHLLEQRPVFLQYEPDRPIDGPLFSAFGREQIHHTRFLIKVNWNTGEVYAGFGKTPICATLKYPVCHELCHGGTLSELIKAINQAHGRPWIVYFTRRFGLEIFGERIIQRIAGQGAFALDFNHLPTGVSIWPEALERARPGGLLWHEVGPTELGKSQWLLSGIRE